jgi:two-component system phosphate regulon sensor histidine kinase PhoR
MQQITDIAAILQGLPLPVVMIAADERIAVANDPALALFGAAILDRHHALSFRQPDVLRAIAQALHQGQNGTARLTLPGAGQDTIYDINISAVPMGVLCAFEDRSAFEQMDQMRRDFVANVSHELRTPLTALLGFIETLQGPARNDAPARDRFLTIMANEAERMNRLVRDLLHLSRVEAEERVRPSEEIDISGLLKSVAASLRPVAETAQVRITLIGGTQPIFIRADRDQMTQVLTNLIENAVKYGSPAGAEVTVTLQTEVGPRGPQLRLTVADQGEGIDPIHIPRLTERFYRVDGHRSRQMGGTGLGLAIVKHIMNRHRGRLIIESEKGRGSRFSVLLPQERG